MPPEDEVKTGGEGAPVIPDAAVTDTDIYETKLAGLASELAEKEAANVQLKAELAAAKVKNFDLLRATPVVADKIVEANNENVDSDVDFDDLFESRK